MARLRIFAPATVANLGPGFDVLGLALSQPGDLIEGERRDRAGVEIVDITGDGGVLSRNADQNVAGRAATDALRRLQAAGSAGRADGVRLWLHKQMPLASGLGSSGASSAAGAAVVNELFGRRLSPHDLLLSAMEGERTATGAAHADNVAPSLMGGIVLVRSYDPLEVIRLPVPPGLQVVVVHPHWRVSTADARALLKARAYGLDQIVPNLGNLAALVVALWTSDLGLLGRCIQDRLVEPVRAPLIPGFDTVKAAARAAGALGCSIAGSGPSVFALCDDEPVARRVGTAMQEAFRSDARLESDLYVGKVATDGARVVDGD